MIELAPGDFRSLDTFSLRWRLTDPKWKVLPPEHLAAIRPLTESKADEIWQPALGPANDLHGAWRSRRDAGMAAPRINSFKCISAMSARESAVSAWLRSLEPDRVLDVIAIWQPAEAVLLPWHVFCLHWDAFCYPASDDVSVLPVNEAWHLVWHHDERFLFGGLTRHGEWI